MLSSNPARALGGVTIASRTAHAAITRAIESADRDVPSKSASGEPDIAAAELWSTRGKHADEWVCRLTQATLSASREATLKPLRPLAARLPQARHLHPIEPTTLKP